MSLLPACCFTCGVRVHALSSVQSVGRSRSVCSYNEVVRVREAAHSRANVCVCVHTCGAARSCHEEHAARLLTDPTFGAVWSEGLKPRASVVPNSGRHRYAIVPRSAWRAKGSRRLPPPCFCWQAASVRAGTNCLAAYNQGGPLFWPCSQKNGKQPSLPRDAQHTPARQTWY
eukprot:7110801-Alexandrium_andersonii.AAC.1